MRERAKINRDVVDGGLKLRLPSKIAFDMNARTCDNKIKIGITLNVLQIFQIQNLEVNNKEMTTLFKKYVKMVVTTIPFVNSLV